MHYHVAETPVSVFNSASLHYFLTHNFRLETTRRSLIQTSISTLLDYILSVIWEPTIGVCKLETALPSPKYTNAAGVSGNSRFP